MSGFRVMVEGFPGRVALRRLSTLMQQEPEGARATEEAVKPLPG
jgi:hypothetical protein